MKGQTALEMTLITALVIIVAGMVYVSYFGESSDTIAETTIRTQLDLLLSQAAFIDASCANARLDYFNETSNGYYLIYLDPPECEQALLTRDRLDDIQGRVSEALGCRYDEYGHCKGKSYILYPSTL
ncbi:MAG: hypothetical protein KAW41_06425 [Candidatus Diapherotrites archaeon]|nr:hypothetical protein [Candidatus Diapherotrites archaeon]